MLHVSATGPCVPVAHGLCISQLLKTQTPNISPMWRTGEGAGERKNYSGKERSLFLCAVYFFFWAEVHVLLKVVWDIGACRSGFA